MYENNIVVTCHPGIAPVLAEELKSLGYSPLNVENKSVEVEGDLKDAMRLNLMLRTANRVLLLVKTLRAPHPDSLYQQVTDIEWENIFHPDGYFTVNSFVINDNIKDTRFANLKVKDGVADRFLRTSGRRPDSGPETHGTSIFLHWTNDEAKVYIDTSGETIAKRGYRLQPYKAPMSEPLAAATILAGKWDGKSNFVNPMCGSGTLAIEAALIAMNKAPGLTRLRFGFQSLNDYSPLAWNMMRKEALNAVREPAKGLRIIATDHSAMALDAAQDNAEKAGVADILTFHKCDFRDTVIPENGGVVMLNPEYGERLGQLDELETTYAAIGDFFKKRCQGYTGYIFTGNLDLAKRIGLKASRRIPFMNGKIDSRLLEYELYSGSKR
ncbi:RNA methyltransferase [Fulvitalea axinellae]|uniref:RNA methyltransferase n=1 Tax=Fulvitalea axinellae TaxID=1182444 RepID=A0AAU9CNV6_9BACT|nr:RNA methyltransferase [Fulvitalea axinellae]